jgi:protoporphyrinogen IX oxidase
VRFDLVVLALHMGANVVWVGALLAVVVVLSTRGEDEGARGRLAWRAYRTLALPGFVGSFVFGLIRLGFDWRYYLVTTHFMHLKLVLVVVAIVVHHLVGAKARRMAKGTGRAGSGVVSGLAFGLACLGVVVVAVTKPF